MSVARSEVAIVAPKAGGESTTVLVVEDEAVIRFLLAELLADEGYAVLEAATLDEARRHLDCGGVDVLLTDIDLRDGDEGIRLAREARAADPAMPVIYASARPELLADERVPGSVFIRKPYTLDAIAGAVTDLLSARPALQVH